MTSLIQRIAKVELLPVSLIRRRLKEGTIVIPCNRKHRLKIPCGIGLGLKTKINANIGTSTDKMSITEELKKLRVAVKYGADAVMDLSVGGNLKKMRSVVLKNSPIPVGTVPIYEISVNAQKRNGNLLDFSATDMLDVLEGQAEEGVDFFTLHCGVTKKSLAGLKKQKRLLGIVSRGGAIIASWMNLHKKENPFYEYYDQILDIASRYDITLSLGDGLRPGSVLDATDEAQIAELKILGLLALRARRKGVQVMIEGPGHIPIDQIKKNVELEKKFCHGAPFYVLGPLVTDVASGYDHISSSIGGALAASYGADFLCYVTPSEHLRHPSIDDVRDGVIAARIAAHAGDIVKIKKSILWDKRLSQARKKRDWKKQIELSIDPVKAKEYRLSSKPELSDACTMCGKYCSIKLTQDCIF
jgi:phosphomethylpyrimidine synthase